MGTKEDSLIEDSLFEQMEEMLQVTSMPEVEMIDLTMQAMSQTHVVDECVPAHSHCKRFAFFGRAASSQITGLPTRAPVNGDCKQSRTPPRLDRTKLEGVPVSLRSKHVLNCQNSVEAVAYYWRDNRFLVVPNAHIRQTRWDGIGFNKRILSVHIRILHHLCRAARKHLQLR